MALTREQIARLHRVVVEQEAGKRPAKPRPAFRQRLLTAALLLLWLGALMTVLLMAT